MTQRSHSITIRDVARNAGVSVATVSRYLNKNAIVSAPIAERIQKVMCELNYSPQQTARRLATRKTFTIGFLVNAVNDSFFGPLVGGLEEVVSTSGYNLLIATYRIDSNPQVAPLVGPQNTDGVVVFAYTVDDERLVQWHQQHFPVVLLYRTPPTALDIPSVTIENQNSAFRMVSHLIEKHGKRRILFVRAPDYQEDCNRRENGYRQALEEHGIKFDPNLVLSGSYLRREATQFLGRYLANHPADFDAVVASDDDIAFNMVVALRRAGYNVPEKIAVAGFDDQRLAQLVAPPLTTVRAPTEEVGRVAGQQLMKLLNGKLPERMTILPTEVIYRQSCGCSLAADAA